MEEIKRLRKFAKVFKRTVCNNLSEAEDKTATKIRNKMSTVLFGDWDEDLL